MSQDDVLQYLKRNPDKWFTPQQLSVIFDIRDQPLRVQLRKLYLWYERFPNNQIKRRIDYGDGKKTVRYKWQNTN